MVSPSPLFLLSFLLGACSHTPYHVTAEDKTEYRTFVATKLTNHHLIPLIGIGLGNVPHSLIPSALSQSFGKPHLDYHLIDTARASENEKLISTTIATNHAQTEHIHVVTKVWYTHLGYHRTKLSVTESLADLGKNVHVHVLLHWPRCDDRIEWMHCEQEEKELPARVKEVGPSPLLEPNVFLDSWRALEELYIQENQIASIGVSNFSGRDWELLLRHCNIVPHIHQDHIWRYFNNPELMAILDEHRVLFQAYNVMNGITVRLKEMKNVNKRLEEIRVKIGGIDNVSTMILAWMLQHRIGVVLRSTDEHHIELNSPFAVGLIDQFQQQDIYNELRDLIHLAVNGHDDVEGGIANLKSPGVRVTFFNHRKNDVDVYWMNDKDELVHVNKVAAEGDTTLGSHPGHKFVVREVEGSDTLHTFEVSAGYGESEEFSVEL